MKGVSVLLRIADNAVRLPDLDILKYWRRMLVAVLAEGLQKNRMCWSIHACIRDCQLVRDTEERVSSASSTTACKVRNSQLVQVVCVGILAGRWADRSLL